MGEKSVFEEIKRREKRGILLVLTGPTCAGKDTVLKELLRRDENFIRLVTTTSRPKRPGEKEGVDYYFVSREEFEQKIANNEFLEWVNYLGHYKGTQKRHLIEAISQGRDVIWRIDVRGVKNIREKILKMVKDPTHPLKAAVFVFLAPPDIETLRRRLKERATEGKEVQEASINLARWELKQYDDSDYLVVNKDGELERTVEDILAITKVARLKISK